MGFKERLRTLGNQQRTSMREEQLLEENYKSRLKKEEEKRKQDIARADRIARGDLKPILNSVNWDFLQGVGKISLGPPNPGETDYTMDGKSGRKVTLSWGKWSRGGNELALLVDTSQNIFVTAGQSFKSFKATKIIMQEEDWREKVHEAILSMIESEAYKWVKQYESAEPYN